MHDFYLEFSCKGKIARVCPLPDFQIPEAVVYDVGIKYIRADIKRIVRFDDPEQGRAVVFNDLSCEEHPACFAPYHARANHAGMDFKIIPRCKMLLNQCTHPRITRQHDIADPTAFLSDIQPGFQLQFCPLKKPFPAVGILICGFFRFLIDTIIKSADFPPFRQHTEFSRGRIVVVGTEHSP